jgi:hypothetical protein
MLYHFYPLALSGAGQLLENSKHSDFWGIFLAGVLTAFALILLVRLLLKRKRRR